MINASKRQITKNVLPVWQIASKHSGVYIKDVCSGTHHCVDGGIQIGDLDQLSYGTPTQSLSLLLAFKCIIYYVSMV